MKNLLLSLSLLAAAPYMYAATTSESPASIEDALRTTPTIHVSPTSAVDSDAIASDPETGECWMFAVRPWGNPRVGGLSIVGVTKIEDADIWYNSDLLRFEATAAACARIKELRPIEEEDGIVNYSQMQSFLQSLPLHKKTGALVSGESKAPDAQMCHLLNA